MPMSQGKQRRQQRLSTALAYYHFLHNNRMITGFHVGVRRGKVILGNGTTPLLEISARGIRPLTNDPAFYDAARTLMIQLTLAMYGYGATLAFSGSWGERRAYRRAGFKVINTSIPARVGRFMLALA